MVRNVEFSILALTVVHEQLFKSLLCIGANRFAVSPALLLLQRENRGATTQPIRREQARARIMMPSSPAPERSAFPFWGARGACCQHHHHPREHRAKSDHGEPPTAATHQNNISRVLRRPALVQNDGEAVSGPSPPSGTDGSNPLSSSGESVANLIPLLGTYRSPKPAMAPGPNNLSGVPTDAAAEGYRTNSANSAGSGGVFVCRPELRMVLPRGKASEPYRHRLGPVGSCHRRTCRRRSERSLVPAGATGVMRVPVTPCRARTYPPGPCRRRQKRLAA